MTPPSPYGGPERRKTGGFCSSHAVMMERNNSLRRLVMWVGGLCGTVLSLTAVVGLPLLATSSGKLSNILLSLNTLQVQYADLKSTVTAIAADEADLSKQVNALNAVHHKELR